MADDRSLAGGEPGGFHDDGGAELPHAGFGGLGLRVDPEARRRHPGHGHQLLRIGLAGLDTRGFLGWAEGSQALVPHAVDEAFRKWCLRPDDHEVDLPGQRPSGERLNVSGGDFDRLGLTLHTSVRLGHEELGLGCVPPEFPEQSVLAAAVSNDQDSHGRKFAEAERGVKVSAVPQEPSGIDGKGPRRAWPSATYFFMLPIRSSAIRRAAPATLPKRSLAPSA